MHARLRAFPPAAVIFSCVLSVVFSLALYPSRVNAQPRAQHMPSPGRSVATADDGNALVVNPANLSFLQGVDARWTWVRAGEDPLAGTRGHSLSLAVPLVSGFGTGFRIDMIRPPVVESDASVLFDEPYSWLTWGVGIGSKSAALGLSLSHLYTSEYPGDKPTTVSFGLSLRSSEYLALSAVAHDVNAGGATNKINVVDRSYTLGGAFRPFRTRVLEIGYDAVYYAGFPTTSLGYSAPPNATMPSDKGWVHRCTLGIDIPYVGRLRGDLAHAGSTKKYVATTTLDVVFDRVALTGGAIFGSAIGGKSGAGVVSGVALTGWLEPGVFSERYALKIRIEQTPSGREHVSLLRKLWLASEQPDVAAVVLQIKDDPASSLSSAYEIDDAVRVLKFRGKKVVCHIEEASRRAIFACASANKIVINPAGNIGLLGLRNERLYFAGLLKKLGIRAQFVRVGDHKSAPEQLTNTGPSRVAHSDDTEQLNQITSEFIRLLARGRSLSVDATKKAVDASPYTAKEALDRKLVDGFAYDDELGTVVAETLGTVVPLRADLANKANRTIGDQPAIAIVYVEGSIVNGRSSSFPLLGAQTTGSYTIAESLEEARKNRNIRAIVLRIDSPGGSAMASDVIWRAVALTAQVKPVIVSMGSVAASGGYYIAAPAMSVFATPFSVTGSIGIFYGKVDAAELLGRIGVSVDTIKTSSNADAESLFRPFTPEEIEELGRKIKQHYDVFVDRVAKGRSMDARRVDSVGRGHVWLGPKAVELGLVDTIGGMRTAMQAAFAAGGLPSDAPVVELPRPQFSLLAMAFSMASSKLAPSDSQVLNKHVPKEVRSVLRTVAPFVIYDPLQPLALSEVTDMP